MKNMVLWQRVCVTDPKAVKQITGKPYKGHSPKPYWLIQRATEEFGPCGEGWGVEVKAEGFHRMTDTDVMHTAVVVVWYIKDGKRCAIEQMGQTKACYEKSGGGMMLDEDAGKKSVTDGMVKCLSMIGFAGDIFSGQWDDSKYVEWAAEETSRRESPAVVTLNDEQLANIEALISEVDANKEGLILWIAGKVSSPVLTLKDAPIEAYEPIIKQLEKKRKSA
jgi:hypothetical protein